MSKLDDPAAPPPYTEHPAAPSYPSPAIQQQPSADPSLYTSHLAAHLSSLPSRIRAAQSARATEQQVRDLHLITLVVPEVEAFLSDVGDFSSSPPPVAELNLVPAGAVGSGWKLSGAQERRREGETVQLVRVRAPAPSDGKGSRRSSAEKKKGGGRREEEDAGEEPERDWDAEQFDEWGRWDDNADAADGSSASQSWWWRDEAMARRLAAHLQPREPVRTERREIAAAVQQIKEEKRSWTSWGRKKSDSSRTNSSQPVTTTTATVVETRNDDGVSMTVRADEITFRRENEMGIWESMSGWALVVTLRIRRP